MILKVVIIKNEGLCFIWNLMINTDGTKLYTTNGVSNDISVIDIDKRKVIKSIPVGRYPWGVAIKE